MKWLLTLILLLALPASAQVPFPMGASTGATSTGGGGGIVVECGSRSISAFAATIDVTDPGCGGVGDLLVVFLAIDAVLNGLDSATLSGLTDLSGIDADAIGDCGASVCEYLVLGRILTGSEVWNGDIGLSWSGDEAVTLAAVVLSGANGTLSTAIDGIGFTQFASTNVPQTPSITPSAEATLLHFGAVGRSRSGYNTPPPTLEPSGTTCLDLDGVGTEDCSMEPGTDNGPVTAMGYESGVTGASTMRLFPELSTVSNGAAAVVVAVVE